MTPSTDHPKRVRAAVDAGRNALVPAVSRSDAALLTYRHEHRRAALSRSSRFSRQVSGDGVDDTRNTAHGPMISSPAPHHSRYDDSDDGTRKKAREPLIGGSTDVVVLSKWAPSCRPLALTRGNLHSQDPPFTMPQGCLTLPQPSMAVVGRAGVHNQAKFGACPTELTGRLLVGLL